MTTYVSPFTGQTIYPTTVSYEAISIGANTVLQWPINGNTGTPASSIIDCTATAAGPAITGFLLQLPPAAQVSTGQSVLVRNTGSYTFTVADNSGNTIIAVASGIAQYIFLTDNTTTNGTWASVVFGAGTSSANASALAGYGLLANGLTLNQAYNVNNVYSSTTLSSANRAQFLVWSSGVGTITLPSSSTVGNNFFAIIRNNGTGILTLTPSGTDTIDGNATQQLQLTESLVIVSNGSTGYNTYAYGRSNAFPYTQLVKSVTGAGATITLTSAEGSNTIQEYIGTLSQNTSVVLPSTVQLYSLQNATTGAYTLTFKTASIGTTVSVNSGQTAFVICDGTNVFSTTSNTASSGTFTASVGSVTAPSINFAGNSSTGFYLPTSNTIGFAVNGTIGMTLAPSGGTYPGLTIPLGIAGGTF
jgi:hypothetical protein